MMKDVLQKKGSTVFLRLAVLTIGVVVLVICIFALPSIWLAVGSDAEYSDIDHAFYGILTGLYIAAIPFFYALYQTLKLLRYVDKNKAFSKLSVKALRRIAGCGVLIAIVFLSIEPFLYIWAEHDDAPGIILFGAIIAGASLTVSVFAAVLQQLLREAIKMKKENDLTV